MHNQVGGFNSETSSRLEWQQENKDFQLNECSSAVKECLLLERTFSRSMKNLRIMLTHPSMGFTMVSHGEGRGLATLLPGLWRLAPPHTHMVIFFGSHLQATAKSMRICSLIWTMSKRPSMDRGIKYWDRQSLEALLKMHEVHHIRDRGPQVRHRTLADDPATQKFWGGAHFSVSSVANKPSWNAT